jgi:copper chaperone CopZ
MQRITFIVEEAGCPSCAARVRAALEPLAVVNEIEVDEQADSATVSLAANQAITERDVQRAMEAASDGAGHAYRVRAGSWKAAG